MPAQLDTVKKVGNLTMTELYRFGMVEIGPGFGERLRTVLDELHGSRNGNGRTKAREGAAVVLVADADLAELLRMILEDEGRRSDEVDPRGHDEHGRPP